MTTVEILNDLNNCSEEQIYELIHANEQEYFGDFTKEFVKSHFPMQCKSGFVFGLASLYPVLCQFLYNKLTNHE